MEHASIEHGWADLGAPSRRADDVIDLSGPRDARRTGIVGIAPRHAWPLGAGGRHDPYLLAGDFAIRFAPAVFRAGARGARPRVQREPADAGDAADHASPRHGLPCMPRAASRVWRPGRYPLSRVATLASGSHHASRVARQPGCADVRPRACGRRGVARAERRVARRRRATPARQLAAPAPGREASAVRPRACRHPVASRASAGHGRTARQPARDGRFRAADRAASSAPDRPRAAAGPMQKSRPSQAGIDARHARRDYPRAVGGTTPSSSAICVSDAQIGGLSAM
ncbi:hypothetical protein [Burkholderia plantarii]|uniref:hypothetical protein n=1 Tax=Burkholderia plantarii TaxID=41899 RepID=UPI000F5026B2|nr:hypothetical protein [Burkholderia plantarii]